eukprot:scaffold245_cov256-Pinguiococcus_pyrenoidosus.AAC.35
MAIYGSNCQHQQQCQIGANNASSLTSLESTNSWGAQFRPMQAFRMVSAFLRSFPTGILGLTRRCQRNAIVLQLQKLCWRSNPARGLAELRLGSTSLVDFRQPEASGPLPQARALRA